MSDQASMNATGALSPPSISVTLALDPFKEDEAIHLSATVVSHAPYPITILTLSTFLNLRDAQSRKVTGRNFHCVDLDSDTPIRLQTRICGLRVLIRQRLDNSDSQYFHTLRPEEPYTIRGPCIVRHRKLVPGHRYRFYVDENQVIKWWRQGTKEDVLARPGQEVLEHMLEPSGSPVTVTGIEPVEFMVPLNWENIGASVGVDVSTMAGSIPVGSTAPPLIATTLSVTTSVRAGTSAAKVSVILTSHAQTPITIWIWPSILDLKTAQAAMDSRSLTWTQTPWYREKRCFATPYQFSAPFKPAFMAEIEQMPGAYRLAPKNTEKLKWWKEGTREEVVAPLGQKPFDNMYVASGEPITLTIKPIEFTIPARPSDAQSQHA